MPFYSIHPIVPRYFTFLTTLLLAVAFFTGAAQADSVLSGYVYADLNINNLLDPQEVGIADVELVLSFASDPSFSITALTNLQGYYEFLGLNAGIYSITQPVLAPGARNTCVRVGELHDLTTGGLISDPPGVAVLLDPSQGLLPHIEGIHLDDNAWGTHYDFGQVFLGKAWLTTSPPPVDPLGNPVPEPSTGLLMVVGTLLLKTVAKRRSSRPQRS